MSVLKYLHLANPFYTLFHTGDEYTAVPGAPVFSDNNRLNLAIWNTAISTLALAPVAYLTNTIINRKEDNRVKHDLNKKLISKLDAVRPKLISDPNLLSTEQLEQLPKQEYNALKKLQHKINKRADEGLDSGTWVQYLTQMFKDATPAAVPILLTPAAMLAAVAASNGVEKWRIKKALRNERSDIQNIQAYVDRKRLEEAGLVKSAADKRNPASSFFLDIPTLMLLGGSSLLAYGLYANLASKDENRALIKYLRKHQLGSNQLQDTPKLTVKHLPVDPDKILATPGDAHAETIVEAEDKDTKEDNSMLEEVVPSSRRGDNKKAQSRRSDARKDSKNSDDAKKDAIF